MRAAFVLFAAFLAIGPLAAQELEITPFVGYQWGTLANDEHDEVERRAEFDEGESWGVILDVGLGRHFQIEMLHGTARCQGFVGNLVARRP